jgi:dTDP-4-dehydrorhamnose 3,5-epimerase
MKIEALKTQGCFVITNKIFCDNRGYFSETFKESEFKLETGQSFKPVQTNVSSSNFGTARGIHFSIVQRKQRKLVTCLVGNVNDYIIDLRRDSKTFGMWEKISLSEKSGRAIFIESGVGHAIQSLKDDSVIMYHLDSEYSQDYERVVSLYDKRINLEFETPIIHVSERDKVAPNLDELLRQGVL